MHQLLRQISVIGVLLAGLSATAVAAPDYPIQLVRKTTVGTHYGVVANGSQEQLLNMSVNGQSMPPKTEVTKVQVSATGEVLAVTPSGRESKARFVIEKAVINAAGSWSMLLPPGTEIVAECIGTKTVFLVGGSPATTALATALDVAGIELASDDIANDDQIFGTKERKKVGDSWSINGALAAADLAKKGIAIEPSNLTGNATLVEEQKSGNQDSLRISASMAIKNVKIPLPPGMVVESGEFKATFSGLFPVDVTKRPSRSGMTMDGKFVSAGTSGGKEVAMTLTMKKSTDSEFSSK